MKPGSIQTELNDFILKWPKIKYIAIRCNTNTDDLFLEDGKITIENQRYLKIVNCSCMKYCKNIFYSCHQTVIYIYYLNMYLLFFIHKLVMKQHFQI